MEEKWNSTKVIEAINVFAGAIKGKASVKTCITPAENILPGITSYFRSVGGGDLLEGVKITKLRAYGVLDMREMFWNMDARTDDYRALEIIQKTIKPKLDEIYNDYSNYISPI